MSIESKCRALAEEIINGLPIRSARIREEEISSLASMIEMEVESAIEGADCRVEDYEEGARAGVVTPRSTRFYELWHRAFG